MQVPSVYQKNRKHKYYWLNAIEIIVGTYLPLKNNLYKDMLFAYIMEIAGVVI